VGRDQEGDPVKRSAVTGGIEGLYNEAIKENDLVKSLQNDGFVKSSKCKARKN
jgi:hypothetical protein